MRTKASLAGHPIHVHRVGVQERGERDFRRIDRRAA